MTSQQTLWKRASSTRPSGRNECLGRNLPNFPGLDKAHCVSAVTVSSSVSASSTLGISCPYSDFIVSPRCNKYAFMIYFSSSRVAEGTHSAYGCMRHWNSVQLIQYITTTLKRGDIVSISLLCIVSISLLCINTIHNRLIDTISPRLSVVV